MNERTWNERLQELKRRQLARQMRTVTGPVGPVMKTDVGEKVNFCSNDYLGLANHPRIRSAMADAAARWGAGTGSSRLVSGNTILHNELEQQLAAFMGTEAAICFPSGYQANVGAIVSLTEPGDEIFSDALVHASIVDGCRLSRAKVSIYQHIDPSHLDRLLAASKCPGLKLVVTDAVFSMDGDIAPLLDIAKVGKRHGALIYVDEAHSLGWVGQSGRGLAHALEMVGEVSVRIGTFGKAFGTAGAFVATSADADGLIRSKARSLMYTTASPAPLIGATIEALGIVREADSMRDDLVDNISFFREQASQAQLPVMDSTTPIQPILLGAENRVMAASNQLWQRDFFVQGMRPPTVPKGTSRLRVTLNASHTKEQIEALTGALQEILASMGPAI